MSAIKGFVLTFLAVAFGFLFVVQTANYVVTKRQLTKVQLEFSQAKQKAAEDLAEATAQARSTEAALTEAADTSRKELHAQVDSLTHQRDDLVRRVRLATTGRSGELRLPSPSPAASLGGPAFRSEEPLVLGSLGEADVDEAARADLIRTHYLACEAQYARARSALNGSDSQ